MKKSKKKLAGKFLSNLIKKTKEHQKLLKDLGRVDYEKLRRTVHNV